MRYQAVSEQKRCLSRWLLVALTLALFSAPAEALGPSAPPIVLFRAVWVNTQSTNAFITVEEGAPQLYVVVQVQIPGGSVPHDVESVTVTLPDGVTQFDIPKQQRDLDFEHQYFRNLTLAGLVSAPAGTYTFTVTDTAGGVTTVTDILETMTPLLPSASVAVSGAVKVSDAPGELFSLDLATNPTPTVTWAPVSGAQRYELRVEALTNNSLFTHTIVGSGTSSALPAGVMVPGRIYRFLVRAEDSTGLPTTNSRSQQTIAVIIPGPDLTLSATLAGATATFRARVVNTGPPIVVDVHAWLGRPDGTIQEIASFEGLLIADSTGQPNNDFFNGPFAALAFTAADPPGNYVLGGRLIDPATRETIAQASFRFAR